MPLTAARKGEKKETVEGEDILLALDSDLETIPGAETVEESGEEGDLDSSEENDSGEEEIKTGPPANLPPPPQFMPPPMAPPPAAAQPAGGVPPPSSMPPPPVKAPAAPVASEEDPSEEVVSTPAAPPPLDSTGERETPKLEDLPSKFYKVLFDYPNTENEPDTLTLRTGDILIVLETRTDGWWRGQSGDQVGLFPVDYCESVGEEEVKAFILQNSAKAKAGAAGTPATSRAELEKEMKDLQAEEAQLAAQAKQLKEEVAAMKDEARKLRKKTREELLEIFDSLPAALYQIPTFGNLQHDIVRCAIQIAKILDIELDHKDLLPDSIMVCSTFVGEAPKLVTTEPKLKTEIDKVVSKVLALQKFFLDEHANVNVELPRKVVESLELLTTQIQAFMQGDLDLSAASPHQPNDTPPPAATIAKTETAPLQLALNVASDTPPKKRSKSTKSKEEAASSAPSSPTADPASEESPVSPREKKRRKKERASVITGPVDEDDTTNGKDKERKKKKKDRESGVVSPRKSSKVDPDHVIEEGADEDSPISPRTKDKKSKKKKAAAAVTEEAVGAEDTE